MKKSLTFIAIGMLLFPIANVSADTTVITAHEEPTIVEPEEDSHFSDFGGMNFILGVGGSFLEAEVKDKDNSTNTKASKNTNRLIGVIGLGGGKVFKDKFYVGAEALFDFTKEEKYDIRYAFGNATTSNLKCNGIFTSLGLRFGYIVPKYNLMTYFRAGGSHAKAKANMATRNAEVFDVECSKIVPTLTLGIEKAFCKKFTARLEGEYRFKATKSNNGYELKANNGLNIRALVSYNVHF